MKIGNVVELKRDNLNGIGNKGDKGVLLYKLYEPADGWEYKNKQVDTFLNMFKNSVDLINRS